MIRYVSLVEEESSEIIHHNELGYCAFCVDESCETGVPEAFQHSDCPVVVMEDQLVSMMSNVCGPESLVNVVPAKQLTMSLDDPDFLLCRGQSFSHCHREVEQSSDSQVYVEKIPSLGRSSCSDIQDDGRGTYLILFMKMYFCRLRHGLATLMLT
jgi:hypothetical protein